MNGHPYLAILFVALVVGGIAATKFKSKPLGGAAGALTFGLFVGIRAALLALG